MASPYSQQVLIQFLVQFAETLPSNINCTIYFVFLWSPIGFIFNHQKAPSDVELS